MRFELLLLACLGPFVALEAKKLPVLPPSHPYVMLIELIFNEDNIIDFITESLFATINENLDENKNCNITLFDVLSILPAENLTSAVNELNITLQGDDVTQLIRGLNYSELAVMGLSAKKVYRNVVNAYFQNATQDLLSCLNILDVTAEFTTAYAFGTDEELFRAFQNGNFSLYNLQEIAAIVNTPLDGISKILGLKRYDTPYIRNLTNNNLTELLVARGLEKKGFQKFLEALELDVGNFKKIKSFKNFYKIRTEGESLGVAVGPNEVITNDNSIIENLINLNRYVSLKVRSLQNSKMKYLVDADKVQVEEEGIFTIHIEEDLPNYINKTKNYQEILTKNCTYVTQDIKHRLITQNVSVNIVEAKLVISKLLGTVYKKGTPLICESLLYGLAEVNNIDSITFTKVGEEDNVAKIDSSALNGLLDLLTSFLQLFDVCSYTDCKVHGVNTDVSGGSEAQTPFQNETQAQSELETQNQFENEAQSQFGNESQIQSDVQAQNQSENEEGIHSEDNAQSEVQLQPETEAQLNDVKSQAEAHTQIENEIHIQSEAEAQNQSENEAQTQAQIQSEIEAQTQSENEAQTQAQIQSEVEAQSQSEKEPEVQTQTQNENEIYKQPETEAQNQPGNETKSESEAQAQSVAEAQIQSETQEQNQSESEGQPKTQTQFETQSGIEIHTQAVTQSDSEVWFQFETENEIQADTEIQTDLDSQFPTEAETANLDAVA